MAQWKPPRTKFEKVQTGFGDGLNQNADPFALADSELTYTNNITIEKYPTVTIRPSRDDSLTPSIGSLLAIGQRSNADLQLATSNNWYSWMSGSSSWKILDGSSSFSNVAGKFEDFVTGTMRYTIYMNSTQKKIWDGTTGSLTSTQFFDLGDTNTPNTNIFTVHKSRVYAAKSATIYFCALSKTSDWTTANDAGSITITDAQGSITGMCEFNDKIIVFTEYSMHELYGSGPDTYELINIEGKVGCLSDKSIAKCNRKLYWVWYDGVYEYDGGTIRKISLQVDDYIRNINFTYKAKIACKGVSEDLYVSIPYGASATVCNQILKYNTRLQKWVTETGTMVDMTVAQNVLYGIDSSNSLWVIKDEGITLSTTTVVAGYDRIGVSSTLIPWSIVTKPFTEGSISREKTLTDLYLNCARSTAGTITVGYSTALGGTNSTDFTSLLASTAPATTEPQAIRIQIPTTKLQNVDWYRLRIAGTGQFTIHGLQRNYRVKTR